jgi:Ca-activated chloride channel family protein
VNRGWRAKWAYLPEILKVLSFIFLIIALARPQEVETKEKRNVEGIDIMIALDVSDSMLIEDMKPENRLEASKLTIRKFIEKRVSDRIGLIVFSGESYTRVPLTLDYPLLLRNLSEVQTTRNIKMGTAIGVALANSAGRLKDSKAKSRIIIFLTDGENNSGTIDPITALSIAKDESIKIYSIGMGRDGQAQLPVYIEDGRGNKIKQYRPMHSQINETLLRRFADETGGRFWRATTGESLNQVFEEIDNLEKSKMEVSSFTRYNELFWNYLRWAFVFYLASFVARHSVLRRTYG